MSEFKRTSGRSTRQAQTDVGARAGGTEGGPETGAATSRAPQRRGPAASLEGPAEGTAILPRCSLQVFDSTTHTKRFLSFGSRGPAYRNYTCSTDSDVCQGIFYRVGRGVCPGRKPRSRRLIVVTGRSTFPIRTEHTIRTEYTMSTRQREGGDGGSSDRPEPEDQHRRKSREVQGERMERF